MLTILAADDSSGFFSPSVRSAEEGGINFIRIKNGRALKKLQKLGVTKAAAAPSAAELLPLPKIPNPTAGADFRPLLPKILSGLTALPADELFIAAPPEEAAEIIEICSDCARLFTVISRDETPAEIFDRLYFNKGLILRRIPSPIGRIGHAAAAIRSKGRTPHGLPCVELSSLPRIRVRGGALDFLEKSGEILPTVELYALAELPIPENARIGPDCGDEIIYLDIGVKM